MPNSILEDPSAPALPGPTPICAPQPRHVYLKDHITPITIFPIIPGGTVIPQSLISYLAEEFNNEILDGNTYPMDNTMTVDQYANYWFGGFVGIALKGKLDTLPAEGEVEFATETCGTFYIKPNYPGRCCHVANGGFMTCNSKRGTGVGKLMGEAYIEWAANLGYTYSVFNLVFETNIASIKIWESLGFKRLGKVKGAGHLRSHPNPVDAIIFGRDLSSDTDFVSDQRFEKIRYYLEKGKYPPNSDRSEKSRLRSASTHYKLIDGKLMLNNKEVVSDGHRQYEIAKLEHEKVHGGINKTTSFISEKYHWVRIKETVSQVIKNCEACRESTKTPSVKPENMNGISMLSPEPSELASPHIQHILPSTSLDTDMREATPMHVQNPSQQDTHAPNSSADLVAQLQALHAAGPSTHTHQHQPSPHPLPHPHSHSQVHQQLHYTPIPNMPTHHPNDQSLGSHSSHEPTMAHHNHDPSLVPHQSHDPSMAHLGTIPIDPRMISNYHQHQVQYGSLPNNLTGSLPNSLTGGLQGGLTVHTENTQTIVAAARAAEDLTDRLVGSLSEFEERFGYGVDGVGDVGDVGMEGGLGGRG